MTSQKTRFKRVLRAAWESSAENRDSNNVPNIITSGNNGMRSKKIDFALLYTLISSLFKGLVDPVVESE